MLEKDNLNFKETIEKLEKNDEDLIEQMDLLGPIINDMGNIDFEIEHDNYHVATKYLMCTCGKRDFMK